MSVAEPSPLPPTELRARTSGFVRVRTADLAGRRVLEVDARGTEQAGALVESDGHSMATGFRAARDQRLPILLRIASSGANAAEGVAALAGWAAAAKELTACSGVVPSIAIASGPAVSGPALLLGLADHVIMTPEAYVFMSGPMMVEEFTGVPISKAELGGAPVHDRTTGLASFTASDEDEAELIAAELLSFLPDHTDNQPPTQQCLDPVDRPTPEAYDVLPPSTNGSYDVRKIITAIVDDGHLLEPRASMGRQPRHRVRHHRWAPGRHRRQPAPDGRRHPRHPGVSQKGGRFVAFCDAFNLALVTIVDTSGFYPGKDTRVARHDPPRRPARLRLRSRHRSSGQPHDTEVLRRRVHRHGL